MNKLYFSNTALLHGYLLTLLLSAAICLSACSSMVGPDYERPDAPVNAQWKGDKENSIKNDSQDNQEWWTGFNDPILNDLIERAYSQNLSLRVAGLRILESRALLGVAGGNLYPQLQEAYGDYTHQHNEDPSLPSSVNSIGTGFDVAWELDFWGKFRRGIQSADANLLASVASYDDVLVTLSAEVARTYILFRSFQERIRLAEQNAKIQQRSYEMTETLFSGGVNSELDVQQAKTILFNTLSTIPSLEIPLHQTMHALSVLLGMPPTDLRDILGTSGKIPNPPADVAVGIPADLLRRRPDIRQAEFQAMAQSSQIGVAKADLYPSFSLFGSLGWSANDRGDNSLSDLVDSNAFSAIGSASVGWKIFNYGRLKNRVRAEDARLEQLLVNYQSAVLNAAREVEDSIVEFARSKTESDLLKKSATAAERSLELSQEQYKDSLVTYERVLDSIRALTQQQDQYVRSAGDVAVALVSVYKALGGGWKLREGKSFVPEPVQASMKERTDWGSLLETENQAPVPPSPKNLIRKPDW